MSTIELEQRWPDLWRRLGCGGDAVHVGRDLLARYAEPHRHYHNLAHLVHCFVEFDACRHLAQDADAVEVAVWFHDAIYDTRAHDNEERSARWAREVLTAAGLTDVFGEQVSALILDTRHAASAGTPDGQLIVDVDLAILGQPRERFVEYERQIRAEYGWVSEPEFKAGRAAILKRFLERPAVYGTEFFRTRLENAARENLKWSLERLSAG